MKQEWKKVRFDDFIKLNRGFDLPDSEIVQGQYPVAASTNIKAYHNEYKVEGPAVITGRSGSLGKVQYIEGKCWPLNTALYVKDFKENLPKFVFYYLQTMHLEQYNAGVGVPTLNQNHLHSLKVKIPPLPVQRAIAGRLSAYDNLIENNNKRIAILEKKAEGLYKEWFVRYRFPGYQKAKWVAGLPEGWKVERLGEVLEVKYGKDHKKIADGDIPIFGSGGIMRYGDKAIYEKEAVLIPRKGSLNNIMYYDKPFWTVDTMFYAVPLIPYFAKFAYYTLSEYDMESYNSGAALPSMTTDILRHFKIVIAPSKILKIFDQRVSQLFSLKANLQRQNALLAKKRDLLLPRLMSGRVSCSASERAPSQEEAAR